MGPLLAIALASQGSLADPDAGVVELTIAATATPDDADAVKAKLLDAIDAYVMPKLAKQPASA